MCTVLALSASTLGAFMASMYLSKDWRIRPVDIQNATLAGGVAVGAICHMKLAFSDSLLVGVAGGLLSVVGYARIQPFLEARGLHDSCGINNLHGMPSLLGGVASVILVAYKGPEGHDFPAVLVHRDIQWYHQIIAILFTLGAAVPSGIATACVLRLLKCSDDNCLFEDTPYWEVAEASPYVPVTEDESVNHRVKEKDGNSPLVSKNSSLVVPMEYEMH